jgi:RNA polymerase sigma-70 factor (ECF subfamily)
VLERLYREEGDRLWRAVLAYAGDREVADDSVAEAFAQLLRREPVRDPRSWVWRASFRIAAAEMDDRARFTHLVLTQGSSGREDPDAGEDVSGSLMSALRKLPPKLRGPLVLHYYAGSGPWQVAGIVGSTSLTVRARLAKGRRWLRDLMGVHGGELRQRFRSLDRIAAPDLWGDIRRRPATDVSIGPSWLRVAAISIALVVLVAAAGVATWAYVAN